MTAIFRWVPYTSQSVQLVGLACLVALFGVSIQPALAQPECGQLANAYGPFDYWAGHRAELQLVESAHFTPQIETLTRGQSAPLGSEIDYTLRAFPNHPRALVAMTNLAAREKTAKPRGSRYTVECWMIRAVRFRPEDANVRLIYANFLVKAGRQAEAVKELEVAGSSGLSAPNFHYNLGLAFFEVGDFEKALRSAHKAHLGGFNLPGLKAKLVKAGKWQEPEAVKEAPTPSNPGSGAADARPGTD